MTRMDLFADLDACLRRDAAALRGLARDLVRDPHTADDVLQEAVRRTLHTPPRQAGNLAAWLQAVVRRLCFQHRRTEQRRHARECLAARAEAVVPTIDLVARREAIRAVTAAVFSLEEPYQSTLLLRYFEDLSPTAIADRTGANLATVKSRLQRGLLLLRARLDTSQARRSWQRALCGAFGIVPFPAAAAALTGAIWMHTSTKLVLGGATLAAASFVLLLWSAADDPRAAPRTTEQAAAGGAVAGVAADPGTPAPDGRTEVPAVEPIAPVLAHPFVFDLQIEVRDRDGLPVSDVQAYVAPAGCSFAKVPALTDANGTVHAIFHGRQPSIEVAVLVGDRPMRRVVVAAGGPQRLALEGRRQDTGVRMYLSRVLSEKATFSLRPSGKDGATLELVANLEVAGDRSATSDVLMQPGLHPFAVFGDRLVRTPSQPPQETASFVKAVRATRLDAKLEGMALAEALSIKTRPSPTKGDEPPPTVVEGVVWDEHGKPVPRATVCFGAVVDVPASVARADDQGRFRFDKVVPGWVELRAGGRDQGLARARVQVAAGQTTTWQARLVRETVVRGRVLGLTGKALTGCTVEAEGAEPWFDACRVRDDHTFELPNQPGGPATLHLYRENGKLPIAVLGSALPDCGELSIQVDPATIEGRLQIEPVVPAGIDGVQVEVRVWQEETSRGALMDKTESGAFSLGGLGAGFYRVEVGGSAVGWTDAGRHWVDGTGLVELGRIELPRPGRVHIDYAEGSAAQGERFAQQVCLRRKGCDIRVVDEKEASKPDLVLPAGSYLLLWRDAAGKRQVREFEVKQDQTTLVDANASAPGR